ncbi:MAG TPA: YicC/YloC family endoribonuclease [Pyrinomonadaceae bacterium]|jgi:uncharacterized protein (TIGR00255 family)|nr:YicC/YloC family endoribonuclease [Pyrinomonadaceae bacterium]
MTGFGRGSIAGDNFSVSVDLKTVNNRFLDIHLRTGAELSALEVLLKKRIGARLSRGRVDVQISLERSGEAAYELNRPLIGGYLTALRALQNDFKLSGEPDINAILRLPGAMQPVRDELPPEAQRGVEQALDAALDELERMRAQEGAALAAEMRARLEIIGQQGRVIEAAKERQLEDYRARLQKRIGDLLAREVAIELDQSRLAQEVAYLADRSDISEEITRLDSHLGQFRATLDEGGEVGKRLDFLLQELNREANTMLSKSTDLSVKDAALLIKAEIEKLREQVQNVE